MTAPEFRATLKALGISQAWLARQLGVALSTVWRWAEGDLAVPRYAVFTLELLAELGDASDRS